MTRDLERLREIVPYIDAASEIVCDGDLALVLGGVYVTIPLVERLRRGEPGPVVRVTRAQVRDAIEPGDPEDLCEFLTSGGWNCRKVIFLTGEARFLLNFNGPNKLAVVR